MKIVKRYSNRKLYDTAARRYVTLDDIARMIRRGENVKVLDRDTNQDVTTVTLSQILHARERRRKVPRPKSHFTRLLRGKVPKKKHPETNGDPFAALLRALERLESRIEALEKALASKP